MIRILTDSASDILPAEAAQLGVTVIPLNVTLEDGTVFRDGLDKTPSEYYAQLAACKKETLETLMGKMGTQLYEYANGLDSAPVRARLDAEPIAALSIAALTDLS